MEIVFIGGMIALGVVIVMAFVRQMNRHAADQQKRRAVERERRRAVYEAVRSEHRRARTEAREFTRKREVADIEYDTGSYDSYDDRSYGGGGSFGGGGSSGSWSDSSSYSDSSSSSSCGGGGDGGD